MLENTYGHGGFSQGELYVEELSFFEAGTYQSQYRRSSKLNVTTDHMLAYDEASHGGTKLNEGAINRLASEIVQLNPEVERSNITSDGSVFIDRGWQENRARFVLTLVKQLTPNACQKFYYIGWTDHLGWVQNGTQSAKVDENMRLYLNEVVVVHENTVMQNGIPTKRQAVQRVDALLNGYFMPQSGMGINDFSVRPIEVLQQLGAVSVMNHANMGVSAVLPTHATFYNRVKHSTSDNSNPANWLGRILTSHLSYQSDLEDGRYERSALAHDASTNATEYTLNEEPLLSVLGVETIREYGFITYGQLEGAFPDLDHVVECLQHQGTGHFGRSDASMYHATTGAMLETQVGTMLQNALPGLASSCLLRSLNFRYSNNNAMMQDTIALVPREVLPGENRPRPPVSVIGSANSEMMWELFQKRFIAEIVPAITIQRTQIVDLFVNISITGDLMYTVSIDGNPVYEDRRPCFCGNLTTNLISNNAQQVIEYGTEISNLINAHDSAQALRSISGQHGQDPWATEIHAPGISQVNHIPQPQGYGAPQPSAIPRPSTGVPQPSMSGGVPRPSSVNSQPSAGIPRPSKI